jgi:hypothetical protein
MHNRDGFWLSVFCECIGNATKCRAKVKRNDELFIGFILVGIIVKFWGSFEKFVRHFVVLVEVGVIEVQYKGRCLGRVRI